MSPGLQAERIAAGKLGQSLLPQLLTLSLENNDEAEFLAAACAAIKDSSKSELVTVVRGVKGNWRNLASAPSMTEDLPAELLAESLDSESVAAADDWAAAPLEKPNPTGRLLLFKSNKPLESLEADSLAAALNLSLKANFQIATESRRSEKLAAILEITAEWNQSREMDQLLTHIAETSTRLLGAERATLFLPDPKTGQLVGRPALGVESGELRIPADAGVVGQVMKSGESQRVDHDIATEQAQINREIDEQLNFQTRSLICVPMIDAKGKTVGAFELINKLDGNFSDADMQDLAELAAHAVVALDTTQHVEKLVTKGKQVADQAADQVHLIGNCPEIEALKATIERVAGTDLVILITGENGTGKEVVAQLIHYMSDRRDEVLVAVNCAAITESLLESELFGHEKGAFTDAHDSRAGKFELADGGTLFLDEIGDMSLGGQAKLLRVLEEKIVVRVGGSTPIPTSARVVAATNQDLPNLVTEKKFREDLFFRLNVLTIKLPPLRERGDDIITLAEHFLEGFCKKARREPISLSASAKKRLLGHNWPGNVRELRNMMERLAYLQTNPKVNAEDLEFIISPRRADSKAFDLDLPLTDATKNFQCEYIQQQIERTGGNMTEAAARLGLHRSNLYRKMRQLEMDGGDEEQE